MIQNLPESVLSELYFIVRMSNIIPTHSSVSVLKNIRRLSILVSLNIAQLHRLFAFNLESFHLIVWDIVLGFSLCPSWPSSPFSNLGCWPAQTTLGLPCPLAYSGAASGTQRRQHRFKEKRVRKVRHICPSLLPAGSLRVGCILLPEATSCHTALCLCSFSSPGAIVAPWCYDPGSSLSFVPSPALILHICKQSHY